jgi:ribosome assembly protein YihI (activator of Der GTPase)
VIEHQPSKHKAMSSNPDTTKQQNQTKANSAFKDPQISSVQVVPFVTKSQIKLFQRREEEYYL